MNLWLSRVFGAATLNPSVYEEVEADARATPQALAVIVLASLAAGLGATGWHRQPSASVLIYSAVAALLGMLAWASWALVTFEVGGRLLPERQTRVDVPQLLRTLGFSAAPALLLIVGAFGATTIVFSVMSVWLLATMVVAVRQALDYTSTWRAVAVCALGWLLTLIFIVTIGLFFGPRLG